MSKIIKQYQMVNWNGKIDLENIICITAKTKLKGLIYRIGKGFVGVKVQNKVCWEHQLGTVLVNKTKNTTFAYFNTFKDIPEEDIKDLFKIEKYKIDSEDEIWRF